MFSTLLLTRKDVEKLLTMKETLSAMERAFALYAEGKAQMPPKSYLVMEKGDLRAMPACIDKHAGIKWVNSHPENRKIGLPTVMAVLIYNSPETGFPLAIMDATFLTNYRTGAAGGVAAKYLARRDSKIFGFIGCGYQAYTQLLALKEIFKIEKVKAFDINEENAKRFIEFCKKLGFEGEILSAEEVCDCDVLTTTTPSRKPVVKESWIKEGTHINAIGADAPGKQELEEAILKKAKIIVDDIEQTMHGGEINVAISKGIITKEDIYGTLGEIIIGKKAGRRIPEEITVFDSTGLAIQDIIVAGLVFEKAKKERVGQEIDLLNLVS